MSGARVRVVHRPGGALRLHFPGTAVLSRAEVRRFLQVLGRPVRGSFAFRVDMPPGGGAGASTACLVALARAAGAEVPGLARHCRTIEGATDPLMLRHPEQVLWASREARTLAPLPPLPGFEVIGGFYGPPRRTDPADSRFPDIALLLDDWRAAARRGDRPALARIASVSAEACLTFRGPLRPGLDPGAEHGAEFGGPDPTADLARDLGALGHVIAHTGSARGLVYAPGKVPPTAAQTLREAGLRGVVQFRTPGR